MAFLLEAVTRNSHKIWLTVLLTLTMLYVFSTIAYLIFHNEVRLHQNAQRMKMKQMHFILCLPTNTRTTTLPQYGFVEKYDCNSLATCFKLHVSTVVTASYIGLATTMTPTHHLIIVTTTSPNNNKQVDYGIAEPPTWRGSGAINPEVHTALVQGAQEQGTFDFAMTIIASLFNIVYVILINLVLTAIVAGMSSCVHGRTDDWDRREPRVNRNMISTSPPTNFTGLIIDTFSQMRSENEAIEEGTW